ncbi:T6SS phospholipase effector Tle1-like catalytic domain-containing protein [Pseudomonas putida]|uniref:T6SS Phospholipase effector Tle1-like catalytic domain-containing protein n=1 Tax=Pseudomonas putida TaxID=303 RepID=A0A177SD91_PSEPU|nr:DUF2235 domain-containing protein [Pseudomonas putida]OAI86423.1 hypothetical protein AYO28_01655 [Pseudomonas putida]
MNPTLPPRHQDITLHLGLFFDGTGMNLHNSGREGAGSYAMGESNVARLFQHYRHSLHVPADARQAALALYIEGIGTACGEPDALFTQATGRGASGVAARVAQVPRQVEALLQRFLVDNPSVVVSGIKLDLFGFSRGAAAARHLANDLQGLRSVCGDLPVSLNFIGLFDTVASIIAPLKGNLSAANADFDGLRLALRANQARRVVHLVAADERRLNFPLVAGPDDRLLPGDHCDIGGGYRDGLERLVLERPFSSLEWAHVPLEKTRAWQLANQCLERRRQEWEALGLSVQLQSRSIDQPFLPKRDIQREKRVRVWIQGERQVSGALSRVYLRLMHERAVQAGVPLEPDDWTLPEELQAIAAKVLGGQAPDAQEIGLLRRRYIHCSANWNAELYSDSPLLDSLFIDRPTADGVRVVHSVIE